MNKYISLFIIILFAAVCNKANAQNITGRWEGVMSGEYIKINIQQDGNSLCGYTYDILINDKSSYCKAYFKGTYDKRNKIYTITGTKFIENSGDHILMLIKLWFTSTGGSTMLRGSVSASNSLLNMFDETSGEAFWVKKVADEPSKPGKYLPVCFDPNPPITTNTKPENKPKNPTNPGNDKKQKDKETTNKTEVKKDNDKTKVEEPKKETTKTKPDKPVVPENQNQELTNQMNTRSNSFVSTLKVNVTTIKIRLYDNGTVDNDTVSIFYNGKLLKTHQRLSDSPVEIDLDLDKSAKEHKLVLFAENLGSIPPNTSLIVVTAGKNRYELNSSASFRENAVLMFDYVP